MSSSGDVVYGFAPDFRQRLASRSLAVRAAPLLRGAASAVAYLTRWGWGRGKGRILAPGLHTPMAHCTVSSEHVHFLWLYALCLPRAAMLPNLLLLPRHMCFRTLVIRR